MNELDFALQQAGANDVDVAEQAKAKAAAQQRTVTIDDLSALKEAFVLPDDASDDAKSHAAGTISRVYFGQENYDGSIWTGGKPLKPAEHLSMMRDFVRGVAQPPNLKDLADFEALPDDEARFKAAQKKLGPFRRFKEGVADLATSDFAPLAQAEEAGAPENVRAANAILSAYDPRRPDRPANPPVETGTPEYRKAAETVSAYREKLQKKNTVAEYRTKLYAQNAWLLYDRARASLWKDADAIVREALALNRLTPGMVETFKTLPGEQQRLVAGLVHAAKHQGERRLAYDAGRTFVQMAVDVPVKAAQSYVVDAVRRAFMDDEKYQRYAETSALLAQMEAPRMAEYGYIGQSVIGFAGTIPYMAYPALLGGVGTAMIAGQIAYDFEQRVAAEGGDVTSIKFQGAKWAMAAASAAVDKVQAGRITKPLTDLEKRQALCQFWRRANAPIAARIVAGDTAFETITEGVQKGIEDGFVAWGLGKDVAAAAAAGTVQELKDTAGTMFLTSLAGAGGKSIHANVSKNHTLSEIAAGQYHASRLIEATAANDKEAVAKHRATLGSMQRAWRAAGTHENAVKMYISRGVDPRAAAALSSFFEWEYTSVMGDASLTADQKEALVGKDATLSGILQQLMPDATVGENSDGSLSVRRDLNGVRTTTRVQVGDMAKLDVASPEAAASISEALTAAGFKISPEEWLNMSESERRGMVTDYNLRQEGQFKLTAEPTSETEGEPAEVTGQQLSALSGQIDLNAAARPAAVFHEAFHAFVRYLRAAKTFTDADVARLREEFGAPRPGVNEVFNEETAAEAFRSYAAGKVQMVQSTALEKAWDSLWDVLGRFGTLFRRREQVRTVRESLFEQLAAGTYTGIPVGTISEAQRQANAKKKADSAQKRPAQKAQQAQEPSEAEKPPETPPGQTPPANANVAEADEAELKAMGAELRTIHPDQDEDRKRLTDEYVQDVYDAADEKGIDRAIRDLVAQYPNVGPSFVGRLRFMAMRRINAKTSQDSEAAAAAAAVEAAKGQKAEEPAAAPLEKGEWRAHTPQDDVVVEGEWEVRDLYGGIITSQDEGYADQDLQGRDRTTLMSRLQIIKISEKLNFAKVSDSNMTDTGAPIVIPQGSVLSGNGRILGMRRSIEKNTGMWDAYEAAVRQRASYLGIAIPDGIQHPVLVRRIDRIATPGYTMKKVAELSNVDDKLQMSDAEVAQADAVIILDKDLLKIFSPGPNGNLLAVQNHPFMASFVRATGATGLMDSKGNPNVAAKERVRRAMLALLVGNGENAKENVRALIENPEGIEREVNAILRAAPVVVDIEKDRPQYSLATEIADTLRALLEMKAEGSSPYQMSLDRPAIVDMLMRAMWERRKRRDDIQAIFTEYAALARKVETSSGTMFDVPDSSKEELMARAIENTKPEYVPGKKDDEEEGETARSDQPPPPPPPPTQAQKAEDKNGSAPVVDESAAVDQIPPPSNVTIQPGQVPFGEIGKGWKKINTKVKELLTKWSPSIPLFQGAKRAMSGRTTKAIRNIMSQAARDAVRTIWDGFGGSGGFGLYHALENFRNANLISIGEYHPGRLAKIKFFHQKGDKASEIIESEAFKSMRIRIINAMVSKKKPTNQAQGTLNMGVVEPVQEQQEILTSAGTLADRAQEIVDDLISTGKIKDIEDIAAVIQAIADAAANGRQQAADTREEMFDAIIDTVIRDAAEIRKAALAFEARGGKIEYRTERDTYKAIMDGLVQPGRDTFVLLDPPYYLTQDYDPKNPGKLVGIDTYRRTRDAIQKLVSQGNGILYTDSAWWLDHKDHAEPGLTIPEDHQIVVDILNALDHFDVADGEVGGRREAIGVHHGREIEQDGRRQGDGPVEPVSDGQPEGRVSVAGTTGNAADQDIPGMAGGHAAEAEGVRRGDDSVGEQPRLSVSAKAIDSTESRISAVRKAFKDEDSIFNIVGVHPMRGGCLICAKAIAEVLPEGKIVYINDRYEGADHYGVKMPDGRIVDPAGTYKSSESWLTRWKRNGGYTALDVREGIAKGRGVKSNAKATKKLADMLRSEIQRQSILDKETLAALNRLPATLKPYVAKYDDPDDLTSLSMFAGWKPGPKVAPAHLQTYRPAVRLKSGEIAWHPRARMHAEALSMWLKQQGRDVETFDLDEYYGDGGIGPDGRYYEKSYIGDGPSDFDDARDKARYSVKARKPAPAFYSQLRRVIEQKVPNKATVAQIKATIDPAKGSGVKQDEIFWSGLQEFLDSRKPTDTVTKDEILAATMEVVVRDVLKGRPVSAKNDPGLYDRLREKYGVPEGELLSTVSHLLTPEEQEALLVQADFNAEHADWAIHDQAPEDEDEPKFGSYVLPGGENYRELLLTLPPKDTTKVVFNEQTGVYSLYSSDGKLITSTIYKNRIEREKEIWNANAESYKSPHFSEPNIVAHVRFNERTSADGKRTLFIEEIQSDWAQKGKKEGFRENVVGLTDEQRKRLDTLRPLPLDQMTVAEAEEQDRLTEIEQDAEAASSKGYPTAPFVTKTDAWVSLALKRMVRWAAENGFEQIAWTTGEQQADRYDLSKQVDSIKVEYDKNQTPGYKIDAYKDGIIIDGLGVYTAEELPGVIGKDLADKIVKDERVQSGQVRTFKGQDLKVGGEGMKAFYDQIVPNTANKLFKRFGAKATETDIGQGASTTEREVLKQMMDDGDIEMEDPMGDTGELGVMSRIIGQMNEGKTYQEAVDNAYKFEPEENLLYLKDIEQEVAKRMKMAGGQPDPKRLDSSIPRDPSNGGRNRDKIFDHFEFEAEKSGNHPIYGVHENGKRVRVSAIGGPLNTEEFARQLVYGYNKTLKLWREQEKPVPVHALPITPEMKQSVLYDGQARFSFAATRPLQSGNSRAVASLAVQRLLGQELTTEKAARAAYLHQAEDATPDQLIAEANRLADSKVGEAMKQALASPDPTTAYRIGAANAELDAISAARAGVQTGLKMGISATKAEQTATKRLIRDAEAAQAQDFVVATGIDPVKVMLAVQPDVFAAREKEEEGPQPPEGPQQESGQKAEPPKATPEQMAERDRRKRNVVEQVRAWADQERARREKEAEEAAKKKAEGAEGAGEGAEAPQEEAPDEPGIPPELLTGEGADLRDANELARALRLWIADWIVERSKGRLTHQTLWTDAEAVSQYKKTAVSILTDAAYKMVAPGDYALSHIQGMIDNLPSVALPDTVERRSAAVIAVIQANAIRQSRKELIRQIRDNIDKKAAPKGKVDATEEDLKRKIPGEMQKTAKYIKRFLTWSDDAIEAEIDRLKSNLDDRERLYDEMTKDGVNRSVDLDIQYHYDQVKLGVLERWGGLSRKLPAEIIEGGREIDQWIEKASVRLAGRIESVIGEYRTMAQSLMKNIVPANPNQAQHQPGLLDRFEDFMSATIRQKLEALLRYQHDEKGRKEALDVIERIEYLLAAGGQEYAAMHKQFMDEWQTAMNEINGGPKGAERHRRHLEDPISDTDAEYISKQGLNGIVAFSRSFLKMKPRIMSYGQAVQLYGELRQVDSFAGNIKKHNRQDQLDYLANNVLTAEDLKLVNRLLDIYEEHRKLLSPVVLSVTGMLVWRPDRFYLPAKMLMGPMGGIGQTGTIRRYKPIRDVFTRRVKNSRDFDESASIQDMYFQRAEDTARAIAFGVRGLTIRGVLGNKELQDTIVRYHGKAALHALMKQVTEQMEGLEQPKKDPISSLTRILRQANTYAMLSWSPKAIKQALGIPVWSMILDGGYRELFSMAKDFDIETAKKLYNHRGRIARYGGGIMPEIAEAFGNHRNGMIMRFYKAGLSVHQAGDLVSGLTIATGYYKSKLKELKEKGYSDEQAEDMALTLAWNAVEATQQTAQPMNMPTPYRFNGQLAEIGKLLIAFGSSPALQNSHEYHAMMDWRAGVPGSGRRWIRAFITNHIIMTGLMTLVDSMFAWMVGDEPDDENDVLLRVFNRAAYNLIVGPFSRVMLAGPLLESLYRSATTGKPMSSSGMIPAESTLRTGTYIAALPRDIYEWDAEELRKDVLKFIAGASAPTRMVVKFYENRIAGE